MFKVIASSEVKQWNDGQSKSIGLSIETEVEKLELVPKLQERVDEMVKAKLGTLPAASGFNRPAAKGATQQGGGAISEKQQKMLYAKLIQKSDITKENFTQKLQEITGYTDTKTIPWKAFEGVLKKVDAYSGSELDELEDPF